MTRVADAGAASPTPAYISTVPPASPTARPQTHPSNVLPKRNRPCQEDGMATEFPCSAFRQCCIFNSDSDATPDKLLMLYLLVSAPATRAYLHHSISFLSLDRQNVVFTYSDCVGWPGTYSFISPEAILADIYFSLARQPRWINEYTARQAHIVSIFYMNYIITLSAH